MSLWGIRHVEIPLVMKLERVCCSGYCNSTAGWMPFDCFDFGLNCPEIAIASDEHNSRKQKPSE